MSGLCNGETTGSHERTTRYYGGNLLSTFKPLHAILIFERRIFRYALFSIMYLARDSFFNICLLRSTVPVRSFYPWWISTCLQEKQWHFAFSSQSSSEIFIKNHRYRGTSVDQFLRRWCRRVPQFDPWDGLFVPANFPKYSAKVASSRFISLHITDFVLSSPSAYMCSWAKISGEIFCRHHIAWLPPILIKPNTSNIKQTKFCTSDHLLRPPDLTDILRIFVSGVELGIETLVLDVTSEELVKEAVDTVIKKVRGHYFCHRLSLKHNCVQFEHPTTTNVRRSSLW